MQRNCDYNIFSLLQGFCTSNFCGANGKCYDRVVLDDTMTVAITSDISSFVAPRHKYKPTCLCKDGYGGEKCDVVANECAPESMPRFTNLPARSRLSGLFVPLPRKPSGLRQRIDSDHPMQRLGIWMLSAQSSAVLCRQILRPIQSRFSHRTPSVVDSPLPHSPSDW